MKKLEIIITILICLCILLSVVKISRKIQVENRNEKIVKELKEKFKQGEIRL